MASVLGSSFRSIRSAIVLAVAFVLFAWVYQGLLARSIRAHPDVVQHTVRDHCRYVIGKDVRNLPGDEFLARQVRCDRFQVRRIDAAGGLIRPVVIRITLDESLESLESLEFPIPLSELVFRSRYINLALGDSLHGLTTGQWAFNPFVNYSSGFFTFTL